MTEDESPEQEAPTASEIAPGYFLSVSHEEFFQDSAIRGRLVNSSLTQGKLGRSQNIQEIRNGKKLLFLY